MADDLMQLQRQAAQRVRRMQEHSRRVFETHQGRPPQPLTEPDWTPEPARPLPRLEQDQWLLLGLALLLFRNGCRPELILALVYLAL